MGGGGPPTPPHLLISARHGRLWRHGSSGCSGSSGSPAGAATWVQLGGVLVKLHEDDTAELRLREGETSTEDTRRAAVGSKIIVEVALQNPLHVQIELVECRLFGELDSGEEVEVRSGLKKRRPRGKRRPHKRW